MECLALADHVGTVDIVSNLFRVIAEDLVGGTDITRMTYSRPMRDDVRRGAAAAQRGG